MKILFFSLCAITLFSANAMEQKNHSFSIKHVSAQNLIFACYRGEFETCHKTITVIKNRETNHVFHLYSIRDKKDGTNRFVDTPFDDNIHTPTNTASKLPTVYALLDQKVEEFELELEQVTTEWETLEK
jgi:hypothetical protein